MSRIRRVVAVAAYAVPLSQVGHALATYMRTGRLVAPGVRHGYFAAGLEASAIVLGASLMVALAVIGSARRLNGRPLRSGGWPLGWVFLGLAGLQLELYLVQELIEGSSTIDVAARGLAGQLPVAAVAAITLRWLSVRVGPAVKRLRRPLMAALALLVPVAEPAPRPAARRVRPAPAPGRAPSRAPPFLLPAHS